MKILCTGGAGFIGSNTVAVLVKHHHNVMVVDNFSTGKMENLKDARGVHINICDITDAKKLEGAFYDFMPSAVIHLAAQSAISTSKKYPKRDIDINILGTLNVIEMSLRYGVRKLVFSSTSAVYASGRAPLFGMSESHRCDPESPYGINKLAAEQYIRSVFPSHVIFRYGNVYGPKQVPVGENQVIARALSHYNLGLDFKVTGDGKQKRDYIYVEDIAYANMEAATSDKIGTFNLCTGTSRSVNEVLRHIADLYGVPGYQWTHTNEQDPRGDVYTNNAKVRHEFGFSFIGLREGLTRTIDWWEKKGKSSGEN